MGDLGGQPANRETDASSVVGTSNTSNCANISLNVYPVHMALAPGAFQRLDFVGLQHRNSP